MQCFSVLLQLFHQFIDHFLSSVVDRRMHLLAHEVGQFLLVRQRLYLVYGGCDAALYVWHHLLYLFRLAYCLPKVSSTHGKCISLSLSPAVHFNSYFFR